MDIDRIVQKKKGGVRLRSSLFYREAKRYLKEYFDEVFPKKAEPVKRARNRKVSAKSPAAEPMAHPAE